MPGCALRLLPTQGAPTQGALAFKARCGKLRPVRSFTASSIRGSRYLLAVFAGLLLAAAFHDIEVPGLAWIAPALMVAAALGRSPAEAFRLGYVAGMVFWLATLHWLLVIPVTGYPLVGWVALSAYLALYPAAWVWLLIAAQTPNAHGQSAVAPDAVEGPSSGLLGPAAGGISTWHWRRRALWALGGAAAWVALEMLRGWLFTGFPWNLLGVSQYSLLPLVQLASVTGVYGVSFVVAWTSLCLLLAGVMILRRPTTRSVWIGEIWLPGVVLVLLFSAGDRRLAQAPAPSAGLKVTFVQPSIPQTMIWDPKETTNRFRQLLQLSERALADKPDLLVWPEAALPSIDLTEFTALTNLIRAHHVWTIIGGDDVERHPGATRDTDLDYFNSAFLFDPEGRVVASYRKRRLVIFGEYVPLARWLPFVRHLTPIEGSFCAGTRPVPFVLKVPRAQTSVLICFEDVFPDLARASVEPDTDFLLNLTNDGWFGESAAQWQHAANAVLRAVENGVPLLRCANNGLTCWVDAHGRIREIFRDPKGSIHGPGFMTAAIPLVNGSGREPTFYHRHGDWFGWLCVAGAMGMVLSRGWPRRTRDPLKGGAGGGAGGDGTVVGGSRRDTRR